MREHIERIHRGVEIADLGMIWKIRDNCYGVKSRADSKSKAYFVTTSPDSCSCPDFLFRFSSAPGLGKCKHIISVKLIFSGE